uniref:VPS9 domain-containing protein n=1 Tax=Lotharella oceanica TaxID=641309 RepID=A0A7S2TTQ5_9EUKA
MAEEVPSQSFFFNALKRSFSRTFEQSSKKDHVFVIPTFSSLPQKIDAEFVKSHVLKPSPYFKDCFTLLEQEKVVAIKGKQIVCRQGFRYPRTVQIIAEETCYNDDFEAYRLLLVSAPLVGRIRSGSIARPIKTRDKLAVARRSISEHKRCIRACILDSKSLNIFQTELQEFIDHFRGNYVLVKGFVDDAAQKCKNRCRVSIEGALRGVKLGHDRQHALVVATEMLVIYSLRKKIFDGICTLCQDEDKKFYECIKALHKGGSKISVRQLLGVRQDLSCNPENAVSRLRELNSTDCNTPLAKLCCLYDVQELLSSAVKSEGREVLAADDMLPLIAYTIFLAGDQQWCSNWEYLKHFSPDSKVLSGINAGNLGYQLANYQAAMDLLRTSKPSHREGSQPVAAKSGEHERDANDRKAPDYGLAEAVNRPSRADSRIREGGSSARSRALRRLRQKELENEKRARKSRSSKGHGNGFDEVDRALMQLGLGSRNRRRAETYNSRSESEDGGSLIHALRAKKEVVLAGKV